MQRTTLIKTLGITLLLSFSAPVRAMDDLEEMIKNGTWDSKPAGSRNDMRQEALLNQREREEKRRSLIRYTVRISNFTETPCSISRGGFKNQIKPDRKRKECLIWGGVTEIFHRGNIFRLRVNEGPQIGCFNIYPSELILEHLGEIGNRLPDPVIIQTTTDADAAIVLFEHEGIPNIRLLGRLAKRRAMCAALALAPGAQPLKPPFSNAQENIQPKHPKLSKEMIEECPICLESLQQNDPNVIRYCEACTGKMHMNCFASVKLHSNACPTCRSAMNNQ